MSSLKGGLKIRIIRSEPQCFRKSQYMSAVDLPNLWVMMSLREEGHEVAEGVH